MKSQANVSPPGQEIPLGNGRVFVTRLPLCMLIEKDQLKHPKFHDLAPELVPIFTEEASITFKARPNTFSKKQESFTVRRLQIPISLAFAITAYKSQGWTFTMAVIDLEKPQPPPVISEYVTFCLVYVMLSRLKTLAGLYLLTPISLNSIQSKPHQELLKHQHRLTKMHQMTIKRWRSRESTKLI